MLNNTEETTIIQTFRGMVAESISFQNQNFQVVHQCIFSPIAPIFDQISKGALRLISFVRQVCLCEPGNNDRPTRLNLKLAG